uniref:ATP synthase complex subunit 8 n=1 Tax=Mantura chrysanthemi TaxID=1425622 RepID=A0A3G1GS98_9CUCU|nr:ATP synthase F0 subunit 8 [Mantura chrysanthemi]
MPQMMPLNWVTLMIFFIFIFYCFNISNYFMFLNMKDKLISKKKKINLNWKW